MQRTVCSCQMWSSCMVPSTTRHIQSYFLALPLVLSLCLTHTMPPFSLQVRHVSDFFKQRPPRCSSQETAESEELERKPSLQMADAEHNNHYSYPGPV